MEERIDLTTRLPEVHERNFKTDMTSFIMASSTSGLFKGECRSLTSRH